MNETAIDALVALGLPLALRTGLPEIDNVLRNDLQFCEVSEVIGESGAGKTQLCYAIVANTLAETKFNVVWLDSNGSFRSSRLVEFINGRGVSDCDEVSSLLDRVSVARVSDQNQLFEALQFINDNTEKNHIRLVVIDNAFEMFDDRHLPEHIGRSAIFHSIMGRIGVLTDIGCTVLVTNSIFQEDEEKVDVNRAWAHQMNGRILVKESSGFRTIHSLNVSITSHLHMASAGVSLPLRQCYCSSEVEVQIEM